MVYDGENSADVYLSYYAGKTCGLCGSFDGDESNDLLLPSGELVREDLYLVLWYDLFESMSCNTVDIWEECPISNIS